MDPQRRTNYEVVRQLGEGGIGRVYEAFHQPSGRAVAIKTLRTEHAEPSSQRLLLNEASAAAQLAHPNIVQLLDVGRDERGGAFLVMELVRGSSLESWASSFPGLRTVLRAFDEILDALSSAHAQGIVHGDLKPGNVLLTEDGRVKITDFGIAHVIDPLRSVERRGVQGTPYYMAPEQLADPAAIGPPTDLYAVGVMLYELLVGRELYEPEGTLADMLARKMAAVRPFEARRGLRAPAELGAIVMQLLEPDPRVRPRFAARVRADLARVAARAEDERIAAPSDPRALETWVESPLANAPTITSSGSSSGELPVPSGSSRNLPFSLPCAGATEPEVALHRLRPLPMLGRDAQAERLASLEADVVAGLGPRAMIVSGRAGEGKTRLLRHGFAEVERRGTMVGAAASFDETIANAQVGLRACMQRLLGAPALTLDDTLALRWRWLARLPQPAVDFGRIFEWLAPGARPLAPAEAAEVASMCVLAASRVFPVYLWLDDVAWSRDGAMELLLRLLRQSDARALVVGTLRSGTAEHPAVRAWLLEAATAGARLEMLPPLSAEHRVALVRAAGPVAQGAAEQIAAGLAEPTLVLVETVRAWIEQGALVASDDGYVLREGATVAELAARAPGTVLAQRIATLIAGFGDDAQSAERVLGHAALLGLRFEERVLRACEGTAGWVDRVLDRALLCGLLRVDGRGAYRFEHRLFLDAIVQRCQCRADATDVFCATARALRDIYGAGNADSALPIAMLYRSGGARDEAAEAMLAGIRALTRASLLTETDRALAIFAGWIDADGLPPAHRHRALLERARGLRHYFALEYPQAREHYLRALEIFRQVGSSSDVNLTLYELSSAHFYEDDFVGAERYLRFIVESKAEPAELARVHHRRSELAALRGDIDEAIRHQRLACETARRTADRHYLGIVTQTLGDLLIATGELEEAAQSLATAMALAEQTNDRHGKSQCSFTMAALDARHGRHHAALARMEPYVAERVARGDHWRTTNALALVLYSTASIERDRAAVARAAKGFVAAFTKVPHDEPLTWWFIREAQTTLRARGWNDLANEVGAALDARREHIARAFDEAAPITEDEAARSGAANAESTR